MGRCILSFEYSPHIQSHRRFQRAVRKFVGEVVFPDAQKCEADGKPPSASVFAEMGRKNIIAMRMGPGKHLKGRVLMDGIVKPEEVGVAFAHSIPCSLILKGGCSLISSMK